MKATEPTYLVIPFEQLKEAKRQAGKLDDGQNALQFDPDNKMWFAKPGADLEKVAAWRVDNHLAGQEEGNPRQDFGDFIRSLGAELKGDPVMDGKTHRLQMSDDKPGSKSGVYVGHLDGYANGWFADHRAGSERQTWSPNTAKPDPVVAAHRKAIAAQEQLRREGRIKQEQDKRAVELNAQYAQLKQAGHDQPYLIKKGVMAAKGVFIDSRNQLVIPLSNVDGEIRTLQTIAPDGSKRLSKGGQKEGSFFVVGGTLKNGEPIVFGEGYATAASGAMALRHPVVMTVDSGNLVKVALAIHERYPDSPKLYLGDDDPPKPKRPGNPGKEKAMEAARLTDGTFILPTITPEERNNGVTDFNDIHQLRGLEALIKELNPVFSSLLPAPSMEPNSMETTTDVTPLVEPVTPTEEFPQTNEFADYDHIAANVMDHDTEDQIPAPVTEKSLTAIMDQPVPEATQSAAPVEPVLETTQADAPVEPVPEATQTAASAEPVPEATQTAAPVEPVPEATQTAAPVEPVPEATQTATASEMDSSQPEALQDPVSIATMLSKKSYSPPKTGDEAASPEAAEQALQEDAIIIETPEGSSKRNITPLDLDALMQQITHEMAADGRSVRYLLSGEAAFVDHGDRITMANATASQSDAMILTALLVAREQYRGRIELTGSDEFKHRAITLIAEYNLDVKMKNPQQQLMLDEARKVLADEPAPGETPTPVGTQAAAIVPEQAPMTQDTTAPTTNTVNPPSVLPPELRPVEIQQEAPRNASRKESEAGLTGTLLEHGQAKYNFDKSESNSYYVRLRTAQGERYIWGKELATIVPESGLNQNEVVTLTWLGSKEVTVLAKVRDKENNVVIDKNGVEQTEQILTKRNQWEIKAAIDPNLLVSNMLQTAPPATLHAYDMTHYQALQQQVIALAQNAGLSLPSLPMPPNDLVWFKPDGEGVQAPATRPANTHLPAQTQDAGTVLMKAVDSEKQLKLLLVKGLGDYVQGIINYQGEYHPVLGKLCTNEQGHRYMTLNAVTSEGVTAIGHGNAVNHEAGSNNAFVFRLKGEKERLYAPLVEPAKYPPALHKQLGFTNEYVPPSPDSQLRETHEVENTVRPTPQSPRPTM
ncbi:LPD7 domain-containing protein [Rahnella aceris]